MLPYHKYIAFFIGLSFLILVQALSSPQPVFRFLVPAYFIYTLAVFFYNRWYLKARQKYNFWLNLRPLFMLWSAFGIFLLIPNDLLRGLFSAVTVFVITFFEIVLGSISENVLTGENLFVVFGIFFSLMAISQYFPGYKFIAAVGAFAASGLLARSFYEFTPQSNALKAISAAVLGFFACQVFWALTFLPFHYSVLGLLLFNFFYFCLILNYHYFFNTLTYKKMQFYFLFALLTGGMAVLATPWKI